MHATGAGKRLTLDDLRHAEPRRCLRGRNRTKADIVLYRIGGVDIAIKDYRPRSFVVRHTLGRWLVARECAALRAAADLPGLPVLVGRLGPATLATRWIDARPLAAFDPGAVAPERFAVLAALLERLHRRGIALGDLHHRDVLLGDDGAVSVVDLATAWVLGERPGRVRRWIFLRLAEQDRVAVARMRARFLGEDEATAIAALGSGAARWHRRGRRLKRLLGRRRSR